jgi:hypothetical protein
MQHHKQCIGKPSPLPSLGISLQLLLHTTFLNFNDSSSRDIHKRSSLLRAATLYCQKLHEFSRIVTAREHVQCRYSILTKVTWLFFCFSNQQNERQRKTATLRVQHTQ